jgi:hypothetical protein
MILFIFVLNYMQFEYLCQIKRGLSAPFAMLMGRYRTPVVVNTWCKYPLLIPTIEPGSSIPGLLTHTPVTRLLLNWLIRDRHMRRAVHFWSVPMAYSDKNPAI